MTIPTCVIREIVELRAISPSVRGAAP